MFKHILVPTDGSELSKATAQRAISFAKEAGAKVTVFFAKPEYPIAYFGEGALIDPTTPEKFAELADQQAAEYLGEVQKQCACRGRRVRNHRGDQRCALRGHHRRRRKIRLRPDFHGLARAPRHQRLFAGQRDEQGADPLQGAGSRLSLDDTLSAPNSAPFPAPRGRERGRCRYRRIRLHRA